MEHCDIVATLILNLSDPLRMHYLLILAQYENFHYCFYLAIEEALAGCSGTILQTEVFDHIGRHGIMSKHFCLIGAGMIFVDILYQERNSMQCSSPCDVLCLNYQKLSGS